jgi:hypothetical protein
LSPRSFACLSNIKGLLTVAKMWFWRGKERKGEDPSNCQTINPLDTLVL